MNISKRFLLHVINKEKDRAIIKIQKFTNKAHVLSFPYDIDFDIYCYLFNYMTYPSNIEKQTRLSPAGILFQKRKKKVCFIYPLMKEKKIMSIM